MLHHRTTERSLDNINVEASSCAVEAATVIEYAGKGRILGREKQLENEMMSGFLACIIARI